QLSDGTQRYVPQPPAPRSNAASVKDVCVPLTLATTSTSPTSTLSLHDALPISPPTSTTDPGTIPPPSTKSNSGRPVLHRATLLRSEEHTSELQSRFDLVCRLLLEKKKTPSIAAPARRRCGRRRRCTRWRGRSRP